MIEVRNLVLRMTEDVERFNREIIGLPIPEEPTRLSDTRKQAALDHLNEELVEFKDSNLLEDEADALIDLVYIALGRLVEMGLCPGGLFDEVHEANMKKKRGAVSKRPNSLGHDAIKPEGWTPPDLRPYLQIGKADLESLWNQRRNFANPDVKLLVIGQAHHGKDTACELLRDWFGLNFQSSSMFCLKHIIYPALRDKYLYLSEEECYADRINHRAEWFDLIKAYNEGDNTRLARGILQESDIYCGLRSKKELHACKNAQLFDAVIWIDGSERVSPEDSSSCTVEPWMADYVVDNNGTVENLEKNLRDVMSCIMSAVELGIKLTGRGD